jgi:lysylphosphatidylglycerol synthetase-like protein (DUF2156 family)
MAARTVVCAAVANRCFVILAVVVVLAVVIVAMTMIIVIVIAAMIAVTIAIPFVIVLEAAVISVPITGIKPLAVVTRADPVGALVGRSAPVAFVPAIVSAHGIPVTINPDEVRARLRGKHSDHTRRWRRTNGDTNHDLSVRGARAGEQKCE